MKGMSLKLQRVQIPTSLVSEAIGLLEIKKLVKELIFFGIVDRYTKKSDKRKYAHGSTKGASVFKYVKALLAAAAEGATGINVTETKSGIRFEIIRDNNKKDEDENKKNSSFTVINILILLITACGIYLLSNFWIGSEEQHTELVESNSNAFLTRFFI